jgi:hypothetical protein
MYVSQVNQLRKTNQLPFKIIGWIERLSPIVLHDDLGTLYRGSVLAQDDYGLYTAIVGTTDRLLMTDESEAKDTAYKILKVETDISVNRYTVMPS